MSVIYKTLKKLRTQNIGVEDRAVMVKKNHADTSARKKRFYSIAGIIFVIVNVVLGLGIHYGMGQLSDSQAANRQAEADLNAVDGRVVVIRKPVENDKLPATGTANYLPPEKKAQKSKTATTPVLEQQELPPKTAASLVAVADPAIDKIPVAEPNTLTLPVTRPVVSRPRKAVSNKPVPDLDIQRIRADKIHRENVAQSLEVSRLITRIRQSMKIEGSGDTEMMLQQLESIKGKENPYVLKLRAFWCLEKGDYDRALPLLEMVTGKNAKDLEAGLNLAVLEIQTNRLQAARNRLLRLSQIYPENNQVVDLLEQVKQHTRLQ
jgi:hypothetical protein